MDRRSFLRASGVLVATGMGGQGALGALMARVALAEEPVSRGDLVAPDNGGYGPLVATGRVVHLPEGFSYVVFGRTGEPMSDGVATPDSHDGMAAFPGPDGTVVLVRNHEISNDRSTALRRTLAVSVAARGLPVYDYLAGGGATTLIFDPASMSLVASYATLAGTLQNCAGGPTPWGSWLSCEETTDGPGDLYTRPHGYVFEVPAGGRAPVPAEPLTAMGRFTHEAVAVDPDTGIVYETEDRPAAGFYRFLPTTPGRLRDGGRLQMLAVVDDPQADLRTRQQPGRPLEVTWVDIPDPDPDDAAENAGAVYEQGRAQGAATFARLEGAWYGNGAVFINATNGGDAGMGQVWRYRPDADGGELTLLFESPDGELMKRPDNVCVSPRGGVLVCEDGGGTDHLRGVTPDGRVFDFGANVLNNSEFCGACFSPDGRILFVNIQDPGLTLAITGPWERGLL